MPLRKWHFPIRRAPLCAVGGRISPEGGAPTPKSPVSRRICRDSRADLPRFTGASAQKPGGAARNLSGAAGNLSGAAGNLSGAARFLSGAARFLVVEMGPYLGSARICPVEKFYRLFVLGPRCCRDERGTCPVPTQGTPPAPRKRPGGYAG